jgi:hypothetical protein
VRTGESEDVVDDVVELGSKGVNDAGVSSPAAAAAPLALQFLVSVVHRAVGRARGASTAAGAVCISPFAPEGCGVAVAAIVDRSLQVSSSADAFVILVV